MKKLLIILLLLALSKSAIADFKAQTEGPDNKNALDSIVKSVEKNKASVKLAYVFRYNIHRLNADKVSSELLNDYEVKMFKEGKPCRYNTLIGSRENIAALRSDTINNELSDKITVQLEDLDDHGQLMTIVSILWDGKSGSSEQCSHYEFDVFSIDGYKLILEFK